MQKVDNSIFFSQFLSNQAMNYASPLILHTPKKETQIFSRIRSK